MTLSSTSRISLWALAAWSLFVWVGRVRNIAADDVLVGSDRIVRYVLSGSFVVLGAILVVGLITARGAVELPGWVRLTGLVLALYGTATWLFRGVDIALGDHSAGFIIVHLVLAFVTISLSVWALRSNKYSLRKPSDARITA